MRNYTHLPDFFNHKILDEAARDETNKKVWKVGIQACLDLPRVRKNYLSRLVTSRDLFHAIVAISLDNSVLEDIIKIEKELNLDANYFCPVWAEFFQGTSYSNHSLIEFMKKVGDIDEFITWGLTYNFRLNKNINKEWIKKFTSNNFREMRLKRKIANQKARGRVFGLSREPKNST